jgi:Tfp pilus assembly protein PilX
MSNAALRADERGATLATLKSFITIISLLAVGALLSSCASEDISLNDQARTPGEATPPPTAGGRSGWTW